MGREDCEPTAGTGRGTEGTPTPDERADARGAIFYGQCTTASGRAKKSVASRTGQRRTTTKPGWGEAARKRGDAVGRQWV